MITKLSSLFQFRSASYKKVYSAQRSSKWRDFTFQVPLGWQWDFGRWDPLVGCSTQECWCLVDCSRQACCCLVGCSRQECYCWGNCFDRNQPCSGSHRSSSWRSSADRLGTGTRRRVHDRTWRSVRSSSDGASERDCEDSGEVGSERLERRRGWCEVVELPGVGLAMQLEQLAH